MKKNWKIMKELIKLKTYTKNYYQGSNEELEFCTSDSCRTLNCWPNRGTQERPVSSIF
ncbi:hypothetical protein Scep_002017 [Stephania cephalantha]|uniref:Uncharacterized protein n=1 Tax=Stephania cephalantha TaxID=152367 RepID=A0AAP0Q8C8_9MAGN